MDRDHEDVGMEVLQLLQRPRIAGNAKGTDEVVHERLQSAETADLSVSDVFMDAGQHELVSLPVYPIRIQVLSFSIFT